jgi:c-di-GMP phosphodiesterase
MCVINYEYWNLTALTFSNLDQATIGNAYIESINWAKDVLGQIN